MRDIISKLEELNIDKPAKPVQEVLSSKGKANLIKLIHDFEKGIEDMNVSEQSMDAVAMGLDQIMADVMEIEGVMESKETVKEDLADEAMIVEKDHEVQMARSELYKAAKYAVAIHKMMKDISEMQGIDGWVASKITKAADYLGSVKHYMEGEAMQDVELAVVPVAGDMTDAMTVPEESVEEVHEAHDDDHAKLHKAIKKKLKDEGGAAGMEPLKKVAKEMGIDLTPAMLSKMDGIKKHRDGDYILENIKEDFDKDHPDFPKAQAFQSEKEQVMDILKKYPAEAKKMQEDGDVFSVYDTDLYLALFDHFAEEMPYGTQKGRDGDPVEYINDELDGLGLLEGIVEAPMNQAFMKQMPKQPGQAQQMAMQQAIDKIVKNLPRDNAEKGIDGPGEPTPMPMVKKPAPVNPVTQRKLQNKQALAQSKYSDWGKK